MLHDYEVSISDGKPIRLYEFTLGTQRWYYNSGKNAIVNSSKTYLSTYIEDDGVRQTGQAQADTLTVTVKPDFPVVDFFRLDASPGKIQLTILDIHATDSEAVVQWIGELRSVNHKKESVELSCAPQGGDSESVGLRIYWCLGCPYSLYDSNCLVDKTLFQTTAVLSDADGLTLTSATFASESDDYFTGGKIEWDGDYGQIESRGINGHVGDEIEVTAQSPKLIAGLSLRVYPGCNRTVDDCNTKFNNLPNCGAVPGMPGVDPFNGNPFF